MVPISCRRHIEETSNPNILRIAMSVSIPIASNMTNNFTAPVLDNDTLQQRLSQGVAIGGNKGSLTRCADKYRQFAAEILNAPSKETDSSQPAVSDGVGTSDGGTTQVSKAEAVKTSKQRLKRELRLYNVEFQKAALSLRATLNDVRSTRAATAELVTKSTDLENRSKVLLAELPTAKRARRNKEEHEALAKMANARPSRRVLTEKLSTLEAEKKAAVAESDRVAEETAVREKQFHLLLQSMLDLKRALQQE